MCAMLLWRVVRALLKGVPPAWDLVLIAISGQAFVIHDLWPLIMHGYMKVF